jgi:predicted component of type VI protein secretion system
MATYPRITDALPPVLKENVQNMDLSNTVIVGQFGEARENELTEIRTLKEAFETYEPSVEVEVNTVDGEKKTEVLQFKELRDFEVERIVPQSEGLTELSVTADVYADLKANLSKSPTWKKVFEDPAMKQGLVELLDQLLAIVDPDGKTKRAEDEEGEKS